MLVLSLPSSLPYVATAVVQTPLESTPAAVQTPAESTSSVQAAVAPAASEQQQQQQVVYKTVKQLRMRSAAAYLPHPEKESYGGEDAHFVSNISGGAIGVADGECSVVEVNVVVISSSYVGCSGTSSKRAVALFFHQSSSRHP